MIQHFCHIYEKCCVLILINSSAVVIFASGRWGRVFAQDPNALHNDFFHKFRFYLINGSVAVGTIRLVFIEIHPTDKGSPRSKIKN